MRKINKKEFDYYFKNYKPILERTVNSAVLSELKGKDACRKMEHDALSSLVNIYWHLAQDFYPYKYFNIWLQKDLKCIDDVFEKLENDYKGKKLQKVKNLHGKWLLQAIESYAGPELEELKKGTSEYKFYKKMKQKGEFIIKNLDKR